MGVPLMGRGNLCTCVGIHTCGAQHAPILVLCYDDKKLLALFLVRRVVEYQIHNAIHVIVSNLLTTIKTGGFFVVKKVGVGL